MDEASQIEAKVDELVDLLERHPPTEENAQAIRQKISDALGYSSFPKKIEAFKGLDKETDRLEMLNDLELLLHEHQLDSRTSKKYLYREKLNKSLVLIIGTIMITLGMGMIIMPAPPYFEMFTIYYFNQNDGITIMDVLSLLIVFTGVYLFLSAIIKKPKL